MKTIVLTLKEGYEEKTMIGYKRIELIPGHTVTRTFGSATDNPEIMSTSFSMVDGQLMELGIDEMDEASTDERDTDAPYLITYEEAKWL